MIINTVPCIFKEGLFTCYYPYYSAEWFVTFRTIIGTRKERIITFGDPLTSNIGISDEIQNLHKMEVDLEQVIPFNMKESTFQTISENAMRNYYIYKKRAWNLSKIHHGEIKLIYIPYQVESRKTFFTKKEKLILIEPMTNGYEKLKKHKLLNGFYQEKVLCN